MRTPREGIVTAPLRLAGRHAVRQVEAATALAQAPCRLVSCLLWRTAPDWSIPERTLDDLFLFLPVRGDLLASGSGGTAPLPAGSIAIVPPGAAHAMAYAGRHRTCTVLAVHAHVTTAAGMPWPFPADHLVARLPRHDLWTAELTRLASLCQDHPALAAAMGRSLIRQLLVEVVLAGHPIAMRTADLDPRLTAVVARLQGDPGAAPPVAELARSQGLGPLRLRQLFHAGLGCSPKTFVDRLRLARAAERLRAGDPVAAVARACGYGTVRQLQVRFKAAYGCTPSNWANRQGI